ncbi:MAG: TetR/AcrR family transcriptional regulator [Coriobacteriia bacterium]|nr:TetR/AcrR family transcriptional regulator [Coriobacteriia bacterium]
MSEREIPVLNYDSETRNKIMNTAMMLFAQKGFAAVSMRDIAGSVGVNTASIYYYYAGKDALLEDILQFFTEGYKHYFSWLSGMNEKAQSLDEVMDNMFNDEFVEMRNPLSCLGMSLAVKEQHNNESARKCVFELFYEFSVQSMKEDFDKLIARGLIPPSDTQTIATMFMFFVMVSNEIRVHEYIGTEPPLDCKEMYMGLKKHITTSLEYGDKP